MKSKQIALALAATLGVLLASLARAEEGGSGHYLPDSMSSFMDVVPPITKTRGGIIDWQRDGKFFQEKGYYLDLIGDEAIKLIEKQDTNKPFFPYFASLAPHAPYQAKKSDETRYADTIKDPTRRTYAAMITSIDDQVGRIVAALEKHGLRENTLIIFSSDNGGPRSAVVASGAHSKEEREASGVSQCYQRIEQQEGTEITEMATDYPPSPGWATSWQADY